MDLSNFLQDMMRVSYLMGVRENCAVRGLEAKKTFWQPWLDDEDDAPKDCSNKQLPTTKWKRERRNRFPEYSRAERNGEGGSYGERQGSSSPEQPPVCSTNGYSFKLATKETPLDMTIRQRGLPPSYAQTVNNPGYRSNYKPSSIVNGTPPPVPKEEIPAGVNPSNGISMCDPIIDEHFRRSLGDNYQTLFTTNNNVSKEQPQPPQQAAPAVVQPQSQSRRQVDIGDLMDDTGMSVDDHFAKALGETWFKLNKKEQNIKNNSSDNHNLVSI